MKKEKILLLLSILCIFLLFIISDFKKPIIEDEIKKISYGQNSITIVLEKNDDKIIILNKTPINNLYLKEKIKIYGTREKSINETIIFASKISK